MSQVIDFRTGRILPPALQPGDDCPCGCGAQIVALANARSTSEIWDELQSCGMTTAEDFEKRKRLVAELQKIPNVFFAGPDFDPKGAA